MKAIIIVASILTSGCSGPYGCDTAATNITKTERCLATSGCAVDRGDLEWLEIHRRIHKECVAEKQP